MTSPLFEETQKFGHNAVWFVILSLFLMAFYAFTQLSLMGVNRILLIAMIPSITLLFYILMLFRRFELWTVVTKNALEFQLHPTQKEIQVIEWQFVEKVELVEYSALKKFGGWGVRFGESRYYTLGGNQGIELTFTNGKKMVLGSRKSHELYRAVMNGKKG